MTPAADKPGISSSSSAFHHPTKALERSKSDPTLETRISKLVIDHKYGRFSVALTDSNGTPLLLIGQFTPKGKERKPYNNSPFATSAQEVFQKTLVNKQSPYGKSPLVSFSSKHIHPEGTIDGNGFLPSPRNFPEGTADCNGFTNQGNQGPCFSSFGEIFNDC